MKKNSQKLFLIGIFLVSFLLMIFSSATDSMVVDEKVHISAGILHTWKGDYTFNTEHPPLLNDLAGLFAKFAKPNLPAIPANFTGGDQWEYGDMFFYNSGNNINKILFWARLPFIFITLGLIYLVFLWARALFGEKAGLVAAALTAFSPNILAHGRLATTDIGVAFAFLLACWLLRKYYLKTTLINAAFLGLGTALVLLCKFSGLVYLPILFMGLIFILVKKKPNFRPALAQIFVILIIPIILVWGTYAFSMRSFMSNLPQTYELSKTLGYKSISSNTLKWAIVPFDKFFQGLEILSDHNVSGHWAYLNGQVGYNGWRYYFPLVMLYKLTLIEIILFVLGIILGIRFVIARTLTVLSKDAAISDRLLRSVRNDINYHGLTPDGIPAEKFVFKLSSTASRPWYSRLKIKVFDYFLLIFPPLLFLAVSMVGKIDIGIRHVLPILPFIYIFISSLVLVKNLLFQKLIIVLIFAEIIITFLAFPNYLAYFNQIAGGAKGGIKHLSDSNIDWNQNMIRFGEYAQKNNIKKVYELCWDETSFSYQGVESEILPNSPVSGVVVICAQQMVVPPDGFDFAWVTKYPADIIIGSAMNVWRFDLKPIEQRK